MSARTTEPGGIDRAVVLNIVDGLQRQLDALRALLAPEEPPSLEDRLRQLVLADNEDLITPEHAAQLMRVDVSTVYRWQARDEQLGHFVGGRLMISMSRLLERSKRPRQREPKQSSQDLQTTLQLLQTD
jgi:hypothetical protein